MLRLILFFSAPNIQSWTKIVDKLTKLSKIGFSMEHFSGNISRFTNTNVKICFCDGRLGTLHLIQAFSEFS